MAPKISNVISLRNKDIQIIHRDISTIVLNPKNARTHSDAQSVEISNSIRRFGFVNPVLVDDDLNIIAGHGRVQGAKIVGLHSIPTITVSGLSEVERKALALADNRIAMNASWDIDLLRSEIEALQESGDDILSLGFSEKEINSLFETKEGLTVSEIETGMVLDRFWISIRGPLRHQAIALSRIKTFMDEFPDVEVELGTVAVD